MPALIEAAEEGKQTVCLVELKARFDERRNIEWSRTLESAGVHVVYGFPTLKIHAKGTLDRAARGGRAAALRAHRHRQLQRGHGAALRGLQPLHGRRGDHGRPGRPLQLPDGVRPAAAPSASCWWRRSRCGPALVEHIRDCAAAAEAGKQARIRLKVNHLADEEIVTELYAAADAGVDVEIFARTTCTLWPRRARRQGGHPGAHAARPLLRAQPLLHLRGRRRRARSCWAAPT